MPFGKHKGQDLKDIDRKYLRWLLNNVTLYPDLKSAVRKVLGGAIPEPFDSNKEIEDMFG
jgi:hypothetical protein